MSSDPFARYASSCRGGRIHVMRPTGVSLCGRFRSSQTTIAGLPDCWLCIRALAQLPKVKRGECGATEICDGAVLRCTMLEHAGPTHCDEREGVQWWDQTSEAGAA